MGIKPAGTTPIIVPPDNVQSRWGEYEASLDTAGQQGGEVVVEIYALADSAATAVDYLSGQVSGLLEDSAAIGDESKTIQQQMRELLDPDNPDSELWTMQAEINELNDGRNDLQDQMIELNRSSIDSQADYISRPMVLRSGTGKSDDYLSVTRSGTNWRIEALGSWVGYLTLNSAWNTGSGWEPVLEHITFPTGNTASPRVAVVGGAQSSVTLINYWVRNAIHRTHDRSGGAFTSGDGSWTTRTTHTFPVQETAEHDLYFRVVWGAATRSDVYSTRIQRNGVTVAQWGPYTNVGPMWPWESGVRTRNISVMGVVLTAGDVLTFQTYSDASSSSSRAVNSTQSMISWLSPATGEDV